MIFMFIGNFLASIPPAATLLIVLTAVYAIIAAAKASPWLGPHLTGWVTVTVNIVLTVLALVLAVPANQLYSWTTLVSLIVSVLGSSGIHGMTQNIPPTPPPATPAVEKVYVPNTPVVK